MSRRSEDRSEPADSITEGHDEDGPHTPDTPVGLFSLGTHEAAITGAVPCHQPNASRGDERANRQTTVHFHPEPHPASGTVHFHSAHGRLPLCSLPNPGTWPLIRVGYPNSRRSNRD